MLQHTLFHPFSFFLLISCRHGEHVAVLPVPVHAVYICNRCECKIVYGSERQQSSGRCPGENPRYMDPTGERFLLPEAVPGLGWSYWGCSRGPCEHLTQPAHCPVSVYLHHLGVLPHASQAFYHVPVNAAYPGHPPAASLGRQVSLENR